MSATVLIVSLDILFVLLLGLGFLQGFVRGVKRSSLELGLTFAGIIIAGLLTPVITNAVLNINITADGVNQSLKTYFVNIISEDPTFASLIASSPSMEGLLQALPQFLLCAIIFLVLNLLMRIVVYCVYKIISVLAFKSKKKEKELGLKRNKWIGGAIGTFKMFVLALVICMPLTSLVKLADNNLKDLSVASASTEQTTETESQTGFEVPEIVTNITSGINSSFFGALNGAVGLDDFIFDNISKFEMNNETIYLRKDISNYLEIYKTISKMLGNEVGEISNLDWNKIDEIYEQATDGALYNSVVLNIATELVDSYPTLINLFPQLEEFEEIFKDVKEGMAQTENPTLYFKEDIDKIYSIISQTGRSGYIDYIKDNTPNAEDAITKLANDYELVLTGVLENLTTMNILQDSLSPTLDYVLTTFAGGEIVDIFKNMNTSISDWTQLRNQLITMFTEFGDLSKTLKAQNLSITEIARDMKKVLLLREDSVEVILEKLGTMLDTVDNLEIAKDNAGKKLLPEILTQVGLGDGNLLDVKNETINSYSDLFEYLSSPVKTIIGLDLYGSLENGVDMKTILKTIAQNITATISTTGETTYSTLLNDIIIPIYKITALHDLVFDAVITESANTGIVDLSLLEEPGYDVDFDACLANWEHDLPLLSQVLYELESRDYGETQTMLDYLLSGGDFNELLKKLDDETIDKIVPPIMEAICTQPLRDQISETLTEEIQKSLDQEYQAGAVLDLNSATFDSSSEESQTQELCNIIKAFIDILANDDISEGLESIDVERLGLLLERMKENAYRVDLAGKKKTGVFKGIFDALIKQAESSFEVTFTTVFKVEKIYLVDFTNVFKLISLVDTEGNSFASAVKDFVINGNQQEDGIQSIITAIEDENNQALAEEILDVANDLNINFGLNEDQQTYIETEITELENNGNVSQVLIDKLKDFFGLAGNV